MIDPKLKEVVRVITEDYDGDLKRFFDDVRNKIEHTTSIESTEISLLRQILWSLMRIEELLKPPVLNGAPVYDHPIPDLKPYEITCKQCNTK